MEPTVQPIDSVPVATATVVADVKNIKTGFKTSEWWITLITALISLSVNLSADSNWVKAVSIGGAGLITVIYTVSRTYLKLISL